MEIGTKEWSSFLINQAKIIEIDLDHTQNRLFSTHAAELIKWTQKINITTITNPIEVASNHFLDSLVPARFIPPGARMLDIGSGGGFPGILKHVIRTLKLDDIEARHIRAEDLAIHPGYINRFDVIISRALSSLNFFVHLALPLLADEGVIIALKGEVDKAELDDLRYNVLEKMNAAGSVERQFTISLERYVLPLLNSERSIITVRSA
jgi:16S rRNA (guanine527-N7)-methyltransferase